MESRKIKAYTLSGLGADQRVFSFLKLNADIVPVDWIAPQPFEKIESYALRLSSVIDNNRPYVLIGVSFGGLIAVEISKILNPALTIIISSASTRYELRTTFRWLGKTGIVQLLPSVFFLPPMKIAYYLFGAANKKLLREILKDTDPNFAKWALNALLTWGNDQEIRPLVKINGTKDKLIKPSFTDNEILIKEGEHFMIVDRAEELSNIINLRLKSLNLLNE